MPLTVSSGPGRSTGVFVFSLSSSSNSPNSPTSLFTLFHFHSFTSLFHILLCTFNFAPLLHFSLQPLSLPPLLSYLLSIFYFSVFFLSLSFSSPLSFFLPLPSPSPDGQWTHLPPTEKVQKESFLKQQRRASRGFMTQANLQLELLLEMSDDLRVARCLSLMPLGRRTAAAVSLCGWEGEGSWRLVVCILSDHLNGLDSLYRLGVDWWQDI